MANKREEEFRRNHERYRDNQKNFRFAFWASLVPSGAVFAIASLIYFIRVLAMLAGGSAYFAQIIMNAAFGTNERSELAVTVPYLYLAYLAVIAVISAIATGLKKKSPLYVMYGLYAAGAVYGLVGMVNETMTVPMGLYLFAYGCYGIWLTDFTRRLNNELDEISLLDGYPDFIVAINEPKSMANTSGLSSRRSGYQKRLKQSGEENERPLPIMTEQQTSAEMEELTVDTPLPKSSRKIDSMM